MSTVDEIYVHAAFLQGNSPVWAAQYSVSPEDGLKEKTPHGEHYKGGGLNLFIDCTQILLGLRTAGTSGHHVKERGGGLKIWEEISASALPMRL